MSAPRIAIDGLWRCLCPSFDSIALTRARLPVRRTNPRPCIGRRSSRAASSRRYNSSSPIIDAVNEGSPGETLTRNISNHINPRSSPEVAFGKLSTAELHDLLRNLRDEKGAYQRIVNLVQYLIEDRGERPSLRHFDALIRANADAEKGSAEVVEGLLREMETEGIIGDSGLYHGVLMTLAVHPNHLLRAEVLEEMKSRWISLSALGHHHLILSHLRDREYELALSVLSTLHDRAISVAPWLYDILIYVLAEAGELPSALTILQSRAEETDVDPLYPDPHDIGSGVWPYFLDTCAAAYDYPGVAYIWRKRVEVDYLRPSDGTLTNILNTAALAGDPALATSALKMLAGRKGELPMSSYEALLEAYAVAGDVANAFRVLSIMGKASGESASKTPGAASTRPLFKFLRESGESRIQEAWDILKALQAEGQVISIAAVNVVLEAAALSENLDLAISLYQDLSKSPVARSKKRSTNARAEARRKQAASGETSLGTTSTGKQTLLSVRPDTATINTLIQGCTKTRDRKATAMYLASEMARQHIIPDELTYDRLILVCLDEAEKDYEDAFRYWEEMKAMGWGAKLRTGTWHALARRCAKDADGRVAEVLAGMEGLGLETGRLRRAVDELWGVGVGEGETREFEGDKTEGMMDEQSEDINIAEEIGDGHDGEMAAQHDSHLEQPVWANLRRKSTSPATP